MSDGPLTDVLDALTHEIRLDIVRALADADEPLTFTELKSRVGVRDSGQFNYHLNELCRHFLTETADGYELNYRGERLVVAARGEDPVTTTPAASDEACPVCGEQDCDRLIHVHLDQPERF